MQNGFNKLFYQWGIPKCYNQVIPSLNMIKKDIDDITFDYDF